MTSSGVPGLDSFETLVAHAPICIHEIDLDGRLTSMNPAGLSMLRTTLDDVLGVFYVDFMADADKERIAHLLDRARFHGESSEFEFTIDVDGEPRNFTSGFVPVVAPDGKIGRLMGLSQDVTDRTRTDAMLRLNEARFRDFAETAADFFWEVDERLRVSGSLGGFEAATGLKPDGILGRSLIRLWAELSIEELNPAFRESIEDRRPFNGIEVKCNFADDQIITISLSGLPVFGPDGEFAGYRGSGRDVTDVNELASRLAYQASHCELTGLANRREFEQRVAALLPTLKGTDQQHVLCYLDLDRFKIVNDTCGHVAGDALLRQVAGVLRTHIRESDLVARVGGDEFAILMLGCSTGQAKRVINELLESFADVRFEWEHHVFTVGASIGMVPVTSNSVSVGELVQSADVACYAAKEQGRNRAVVFSPNDTEMTRRQDEMRSVSRITSAFDDDRFTLFAQPIVEIDADVADGRRFEVLVRMYEPDGALTLPGEFLPAAERYGLVTQLDAWVLEHTLGHLEDHSGEAPDMVAINLSGASLGEADFLDQVTALLDASTVDPSTLCFEVTETAAITRFAHADRFIDTLRRRGCRFALDDFGTGMSSFAYLKSLNVDILKIDGTFVRDILTDPVDFALVRSITDIGKQMGKTIIAEWVENQQILEALHDLEIDYVQGFHFGPPLPLPDVLALAD